MVVTNGLENGTLVPSRQRTTSLDRQNSGARAADLYLSELLSYSLDRLRKEPELLQEEKDRLDRSLQTKAVSHYQAFIDTASCLDGICTKLDLVKDSLEQLTKEVPQFTHLCETFSGAATDILKKQNDNKQVLGHHNQLVELLETPQLMDTCVRNGVCDEALDLHAFVQRLALLHPDIPLVKVLQQQVAEVADAMLHQLLDRLRSSIQLPECLRVLGYLRRIATFSEQQLRLHFLTCREQWFEELVAELEDREPYEYLKHLTDLYRLHLFDVVMQYRAIFFDAAAYQGDVISLQDQVLYSWVSHRVEQYLEALETYLPRITEGSSIAGILEQCMYCSSSLGRVGVDFIGLVGPIFQDVILAMFSSRMSVALELFTSRLDSYKWLPLPTAVFQRPGPTGEGPKGLDSGVLAPPFLLMEHYPLAVLTNAVLSGLNELRHCTPLGLSQHLVRLLQLVLEQVSSSLVHYHHSRPLAEGDQQLFLSACKMYADVVVPYLTQCFSQCFGGSAPSVDTQDALRIIQEVLGAGPEGNGVKP